MNSIVHLNKRTCKNIMCMSLGGIVLCFSLITIFGAYKVSAVDTFSENDTPLGISASVWIEKWWMWWFAVPYSEIPIEDKNHPGSKCLMNISDSMVMLMETTVSGPGNKQQVCNISSEDSIMIPLWTGFYWQTPGEQITDGKWNTTLLNKAAQEKSNNADSIESHVEVDGKTIANLVVKSGVGGVKYDTKVNVTEVYSDGFNFTIYKGWGDRFLGEQDDTVNKTFDFGAHGWFVFLKPLEHGDHTIFYTLSNSGQNVAGREIKYLFHVS